MDCLVSANFATITVAHVALTLLASAVAAYFFTALFAEIVNEISHV